VQHSEFVHLHVHSEYSLLDGAAQLEKLVQKAKELRFPAIALTDHGNLFGAIDFYLAAQKAGIKPILGCELNVAPGSRRERGSQDGGYEGANHLTVLVRNRVGYQNLVKLVSKAYLEGFYYKPRVDRELLAQHADGLVVLSGCLNSEVSRLLGQGETQKAKEIAGYQEVVGRDYYFMEVQSHGLEQQARVTRHPRDRQGHRRADRRHQRLALPRGGARARPRGAPLHSDGHESRRPEPLPVLDRRVLRQVGGGDGPRLRRVARGVPQHAGRRRAL